MPPAKKAAAKKPAKPKEIQEQEIVEVVDPSDPLDMINSEKLMVYMFRGASFYGEDFEFTREQPFKLLDGTKANELVKSMPERFSMATKEQVEKFYSLG